MVDSVRVSKLRLFADYLCGVDPPLMSYDVERSCYISAVTPLYATADTDQQQRDAAKLSDTEAKVFTARRNASAVYAVLLCLSIGLSVRHKPALYQNG